MVNLPRGSQVISNDKLGGVIVMVHAGTTINIQGNADEKTIQMMQQELAKRGAAFASNVVETVKRAKTSRQL